MSVSQLQKELLKKGYNVKFASEIIDESKIKTGIFTLDYVLSGGIVQCEGGHRIEFWGNESSGKTSFSLHIIKKFQSLGKNCVFIDAEDSYDKTWASLLGVDNEKLTVIKPTSLELFGDMATLLVPQVDLIVIDSIVSLIPESEMERDTNSPTMALSARINALITRKIYNVLANRTTTMIFINQLREKLSPYGNPYVSGGGHALKHFYNTRIEFKTGKPIDTGTGDNKERLGYEINLKCIKNKKGKPFRTGVIELYFDGSLDNNKSIFFAGLKNGIIEKSGNSYVFGETKIVGKDNFIEQFTDWDKLEEEIWKVIK